MIPFSVLDLSPIVAGGTARQSLLNTLDLAQHAERWGYHRYWLAEHHNMRGIASAATAVAIGYVAAGTKTIRVGSGGVMLPNHAPLVIAEQFGTLESLYPGRIDLGLGRAPGTDQRTVQALRRNLTGNEDDFPRSVVELQAFLGPVQPGQAVVAVPGAGLKVPIWLLGSSLYSAQLSAMLGLPFAFASHFAPEHLMAALEIYRRHFRASESLAKPYVMVGATVMAADTDAEAKYLFTSLQQQYVNRYRNARGPLPAPVDSMEGIWSPAEREYVEGSLGHAIVGPPQSVKQALDAFIAVTQADELIVTAQIFDHAARRHSFEIVAALRGA